ncbi:type II toxin-antitoxin system RelE/ParE family toxin [Cupriavidus necator]|uniref:type II toxin-antitoxin system RelE family toxin n=1 Tax=Cupriavidus necator TaxID=106590 RepID=UPI0039C4CEAA
MREGAAREQLVSRVTPFLVNENYYHLALMRKGLRSKNVAAVRHACDVRDRRRVTMQTLFAAVLATHYYFMYAIEFTRQAAKALKAMPTSMAATIRAKIDALAVDPYAPNPNARKLAGREGYRLRVGDWRVLYQIENGRLVIVVLAVSPRGGAYK